MADKTFEDEGLEVKSVEVEVGKSYPLFGMITSILDKTLDNFTAVINYNIKLRINVQTQEHLTLITDRIFESGIFVAEITKQNPLSDDSEVLIKNPETVKLFPYEGVCTTVIYGKRTELNG